MSENNVKAITQDHWGFLWFGTKNGLNRYDGNGVKLYNVSDEVARQGNNNVSALFEDSQYRLWIGTDRGVFLFNPYTEKFSFFAHKTKDGEQITNWISQITSDHDGNIWIVAPDQGAFCFNEKRNRLRLYQTNNRRNTYVNNPQSVCVLKNGSVWIGTNGAGLFRVNRSNGRLERFVKSPTGQSLEGKSIYTMCEYGDWIVVGEHEGRLMKFNPTTRELTEVRSDNVHYKIIRGIYYDGTQLFVATHDGLYIIDEKRGKETHITEMRPWQSGSLSDNMLYTLYGDRDNGVWLGTFYSGVNYMIRKGLVFSNYTPGADSKHISNRCPRDMVSDKNGNVWIASEEGTVDKYDPRTHSFTHIKCPSYKGGNNRLSLMANGEHVWVGVFKNGIDVIDIRTNTVVKHYKPSDLNLQMEGSVYSMLRDRGGRVWLGTGRGLYLGSEDMRFAKVTSLPNLFVLDIKQDRNGDLWIATMGMGVYRFSPKTKRVVHYRTHEGKNSISSNSISSITMDHNGDLWFSTDRGGICVYRFKTDKFQTYSTDNGLPDNIAYKIMEDKRHCLWFGTNHGLVQFNPKTGAINVFRNSNGLLGNQYCYKSATETCTGTFLVGGVDGLVEFDPLLASNASHGKKVCITNIKVDNVEVRPGGDGILTTNILHTKEICLPYNMSSVELSVATLNFSEAETDDLEYMLGGLDKNWVRIQNGQKIYFSRLQPGDYVLKVRHAGDNTGVTELRIHVSPPWWFTIWAKIFYGVVACALAVYVYRRLQQRQLNRLKLREERFKEAKDKELLEAKIEFFTDVTHEIRTPLTLINGSVENVLEEHIDNSNVAKNLVAIGKNCKRLLNLVNQLLDFRKVGANVHTLTITNMDICTMITSIVERFEPTIVKMGKIVSVDLEEDSIIVAMDVEAVTKILSNLLNNARKYSDSFIQISVRRRGDEVVVAVTNDGRKIPADKAETIFAPFEQLENHHGVLGSGIGLALARSLAELHNGTLRVDTMSEYNRFVLTLPLHQNNVSETGSAQLALEDAHDMVDDMDVADYETNNTGDKEYTIMVVEDNGELKQMIAEKLASVYNVLTASNGVEGLQLLADNHVDIIVCDIMMPVMDGLQFTASVKDNIEINHIPIILLTAKTTLQSHIDGLKVGADAYMEKPFSFVHLLTQIETLINNRKREQANFVHKPYLPVQNSKINKAGEEFLSKVSNLITSNIKDPQFNVEQLAQEMCMSRSSLHRKIKEVSNMTPIDFIRLIRLKKAAELIRDYDYRSLEVCEMVGINSPSYFIKLFQKQFGMTPKEFAMQNKHTHNQ